MEKLSLCIIMKSVSHSDLLKSPKTSTFGLFFVVSGFRFAHVGNYNFHLARGQEFLAGMVVGFGLFHMKLLVTHPFP